MSKTKKEAPQEEAVSSQVRTHIVYVQRQKDPRGPKFAGYAINGHLTRAGKKIPVEEFVKSLNETSGSKKNFFFEAVGKK